MAISPNGKMKFSIILGSDYVLRLEHSTKSCSTNGSLAMQVTACNLVTRQNKLVHHASNDGIYQTLLHSLRYKASGLPELHYDFCALANSRRRGLKHKPVHSTQVLTMLDEADYNDHDPLSDSSDEEFNPDDVIVAMDDNIVFSREKTIQMPRFDIDELRPFEVMMCDNKDFPIKVRGGYKVAFLLIDVKTQRKFVIKLDRKVHNHKAMNEIIATTGCHKLPHACTLYSDGCGSMKDVRELVMRLSLIHISEPTRPY